MNANAEMLASANREQRTSSLNSFALPMRNVLPYGAWLADADGLISGTNPRLIRRRWSNASVLQQRSQQLKRDGEDADAQGDDRECAERNQGGKVHQRSCPQDWARLGGGTHSQPSFTARWSPDPKLSADFRLCV
jgi:hypothetical protein